MPQQAMINVTKSNFPRDVWKRGRKPRNPVERLRTLVFMRAVCLLAGIQFKGYQLEDFFEPEKIIKKPDGTYKRGCKWDRFVTGGVSPSPETLSLIFKTFPNEKYLKEVYYSPLWKAMEAGQHSPEYWLKFYQSLRFSLQKLMFKPTSNLIIKKPQNTTIDAILRQGDLQALGCLISIIRNNNLQVAANVKYHAEFSTYQLLLWTFRSRIFSPFLSDFWQYIKSFVLTENHPAFDTQELWGEPINLIHQHIFYLHSYVLRAEDLNLITTEKQTTEFLYWFYKGDTELIASEINEAKPCKQYHLGSNNTGLKWLVNKLNKTRSLNDQIGDVI